MKVSIFGKLRDGLKAVNHSARSVVSSDALVSEPMSQVEKITTAFTMALITILSTVIFVYLAGAILAHDGYLAGLVADILAGYCINSGQCNFSEILPAFAIAVIILTDLVIFLLAAVLQFAERPEDEVISNLSERIVAASDSIEQRFDDLETLIKDGKG